MEGPAAAGQHNGQGARSPARQASLVAFASATSQFCPPAWAEPTGDNQSLSQTAEAAEGQAGETPTVLTKLQKWGDYDAVGSPVWPTRFVPMKTPMSKEIMSNWSLPDPPRHSLTVPQLLERQEARGQPIGLIIDLANHECLYYDDIPEEIEYETVQLVAKVLPPPEAINEVEEIARSYWADHPDKYIAIHCAYGFNRTGFVVCSYLCQACGLTVQQALDSFAAARPPGVKHEKFIAELHARYGGGGSKAGSQVPSAGGSMHGSSTAAAAVAAASAAVQAASFDHAASSSQSSQALMSAADAGGSVCGRAADGSDLDHSARAGATRVSSHSPTARLQQQEKQQEDQAFEQNSAAALAAAAGKVLESLPGGSGASQGGPAAEAQQCRARSAGSPGGARPSMPRGRPPQWSPGSRQHSRASSGLHEEPSDPGVSSLGTAEQAGGGLGPAGWPSAEDLALGSSPEDAQLRQRSRKSSRGALSIALQRSASGRSTGGSSRASSSSQPPGSSPTCTEGEGGAQAVQSLEQLTAMAMHLEEARAMPRSTSMGLARALNEDFTVNNGTPTLAAPITDAMTAEERAEAEAAALALAIAAVRDADPESALTEAGAAGVQGLAASCAMPAARTAQQLDLPALQVADSRGFAAVEDSAGTPAAAGSVSGRSVSMDSAVSSPPPSPFQQSSPATCPRPQHGAAAATPIGILPAAWAASSPAGRQHSSGQLPPTGSPGVRWGERSGSLVMSRSAGSSLPPFHRSVGSPPLGQAQPRSLGAAGPPYQGLGHVLTPVPGSTPLTEASTGSMQRSLSRVPRSLSAESDNPSLGFGARDVLLHLQQAAGLAGSGGGGVPTTAGRGVGGAAANSNSRGPQALAELFRDDSRKDLSELDPEAHLEAAAQARPESPAVAGTFHTSFGSSPATGLGGSPGAAQQLGSNSGFGSALSSAGSSERSKGENAVPLGSLPEIRVARSRHLANGQQQQQRCTLM